MPARKRRSLNWSSSAPSIKIRLSHHSATSLIFHLKYFHKPCALSTVIVMLQRGEKTEVTQVDLRDNAGNFP